MIKMLDKEDIENFDWDEGNIKKNEIKHGVFFRECEEIFTDAPIFYEDPKHSISEKRFQCIGFTKKNKQLFISFTLRKQMIRIISARSASRKEKRAYEKAKKNS